MSPSHSSRTDDIPGRDDGRRRLVAVLDDVPERWLLVNVATQTLTLFLGDRPVGSFGVSTAAAGMNGAEGSFGTPPGVHRIAGKIGDDQPVGTWFQSREPAGRWPEDAADDDDLILSRILTLDGCEPGVNRGPGCDSRERFIYIHGTNHEEAIGRPVSQGCVRLSNTDVIRLFERVEEGDPVVIV